MDTENVDAVRKEVRDHYGQLSREGAGCCGAGGCCVANPGASEGLGYSAEQLAGAPEGANLGLGCGNPQAIARLVAGERVLDLGSGGGFDCFLAARQVGPTGHVIGVDMTPDMLERARGNARKVTLPNVEFRLGEIEHLPVADAEVDVVISNCVINLSPEKPAVLREAFRVLRPGGRLAVSDVVALAPLTPEEKADVTLYTGCVAGAATIDELRAMLADAGFAEVDIDIPALGRATVAQWFRDNPTASKVAAASIEARRPGGARIDEAQRREAPADVTASPARVDEDWSHLRAQVLWMVRGASGARLTSPADAEDVVQDVLLRVFRNAGQLRDEDRFGAWLATMVRNAITDQQRSRQRHPFAPDVAGERIEAPALPTEESDQLARIRVVAALRPFAERLPALYRDVIILSELEDVPHAEIARRLDMSVSGVKSRVLRGREQLREMLTDCCEISLDARHAIVDCVPKAAAPGPACCGPDVSSATAKRA